MPAEAGLQRHRVADWPACRWAQQGHGVGRHQGWVDDPGPGEVGIVRIQIIILPAVDGNDDGPPEPNDGIAVHLAVAVGAC